MSYVTLAFSQSSGGVLGRSTVVGGLLLDAAVSESISLASDVTEHEVEEGSDITDHIRNRPETLTISGIVGDASLAILPSAASLFRAAFNGMSYEQATLSNPFGSSISSSDLAGARRAITSAKRLPPSGRARLMQAVDTLYAAWKANIGVSVVTGLRFYDNYYITGIDIARSNQETGGMIAITVNLKTIRIVSTQTGTLEYPPSPNNTGTTNDAAKSKVSQTAKNKGQANQKTTSAASKGKAEAILYAE